MCKSLHIECQHFGANLGMAPERVLASPGRTLSHPPPQAPEDRMPGGRAGAIEGNENSASVSQTCVPGPDPWTDGGHGEWTGATPAQGSKTLAKPQYPGSMSTWPELESKPETEGPRTVSTRSYSLGRQTHPSQPLAGMHKTTFFRKTQDFPHYLLFCSPRLGGGHVVTLDFNLDIVE